MSRLASAPAAGVVSPVVTVIASGVITSGASAVTVMPTVAGSVIGALSSSAIKSTVAVAALAKFATAIVPSTKLSAALFAEKVCSPTPPLALMVATVAALAVVNAPPAKSTPAETGAIMVTSTVAVAVLSSSATVAVINAAAPATASECVT